MKKFVLFIFLTAIITSCIPTKIAPRFKNEDYKVMQAKKFERKLPRETSFIFKDPKDADEFYQFINIKLNLQHKDVGYNSPFQLDGATYYLSYKEVGKEDRTLNIGLAAVDLVLSEKAGFRVVDENYDSRKGHWYILITVYDEKVSNCLLNKHSKRQDILQYLKSLKKEYLDTHNYEELLFTKKS